MTFAEAKADLRRFAKGKYFSLSYSFSEFSSKDTENECGVYVDKLDWHKADSFEDAIRKLKGVSAEKSPIETGEPQGNL